MKKILLVFILVFSTIISIACTIAPYTPSEGIWYCEKLKLAIEFNEANSSVYSYDTNLSHIDLQVRSWIDGGFDIIYENDEEVIEVYSGWRKSTTKDKLTIILYSKANPEDDFKTQIDLNDEEYTFVKIESYDEIN